MADTRLIERWLPIAALGIESVRERTPMTPFPAPNRLHVWWARAPLVASRAAILASLLPADADQRKFLRALGIHGDPVEAKKRIAAATRNGERLGADAYGYKRAFSYSPDEEDREWIKSNIGAETNVLDPTAGGGSIPFETSRLGLKALANDLNPVACLIEDATIAWPSKYGDELRQSFGELGSKLTAQIRSRLAGIFPDEPDPDTRPDGYLWARTITCPYCDGLVPLSPNWRLAPSGKGVRLKPDLRGGPGSSGRRCEFEIVDAPAKQSAGTVAGGDGHCPYDDCGRVIDGDEIKRQAQAGGMGEQLYTVVYKKRVPGKLLKSGRRGKGKWVRGYRAPRPQDDNSAAIAARLAEKLPEWEAFDMVPSEKFPEVCNDDRPIQYGMPLWRDLFSPRQLLCHGTSVEVFREMLEMDRAEGELSDVRKAAYGYLAISLDKLLNYNSRMTRWISQRGVIAGTFDRHDYALKWSYAEMAPLVTGVGYDWAIGQTTKCIGELVDLIQPQGDEGNTPLFPSAPTTGDPPPATITCKSADSLDHIADASIDAVIIDPPYHDNVMYAELSDFFYVWLKRTAGHVFPELFRRQLSDKDNEAVASQARFQGFKGKKALAERDYQERMGAIFAESRRALKPDGIMTVMFTHKATGAWDALTKGLMEAGFVITASWPVNTAAEGSLHVKEKAAAKSTIFLVCRPRSAGLSPANVGNSDAATGGAPSDTEATAWWEDVEPVVAKAVRTRVAEFQEAGIGGVDLYLASFGPALEEFSRHWPLKRGTPREMPEQRKRRRQLALFEEEWDPYEVTPEDALDTARREVKRWRLEQLTHLKANADLDPPTAFFVLAWDAFRAPVFAYDEALRLARAVGADLDREIVGRLAGKKGSDIQLWDSGHRAAKGALGPADGARGMIDALHHAANLARTRSLDAARDLLDQVLLTEDPRFTAALEATLEVLPVSRTWSGIELTGAVAAAGDDFEALYKLARLAFTERIDEPKQIELLRDDKAGHAARG
ncbi:MAG: DUF1156 domain-containing protein [Gammaproteobacteria bacterium]|nr:DUF1156 domain-containing protein [Gammaproteobacteria bacterium]